MLHAGIEGTLSTLSRLPTGVVHMFTAGLGRLSASLIISEHVLIDDQIIY